jgi:hypothetical protein
VLVNIDFHLWRLEELRFQWNQSLKFLVVMVSFIFYRVIFVILNDWGRIGSTPKVVEYRANYTLTFLLRLFIFGIRNFIIGLIMVSLKFELYGLETGFF